MQRLLFGAIAGVCATMAMTSGMRLLFGALGRKDRYPLPPRELTERLTPARPHPDRGDPDAAPQEATMAAHFVYGAATGALLPLVVPRPGIAAGSIYGALVWAASYLGWIPALGVLRPASEHPGRRNLLMIAAHLVWGAALAVGYRALVQAEEEAFAAGGHIDAPDPRRTTQET